MQGATTRSTHRMRASGRLSNDEPYDPRAYVLGLPFGDSTPSDTISIEDVDVQTRVSADTRIPVTVGVRNDITDPSYYDRDHPDFCQRGFTNKPGWNLIVRANLAGSADDTTFCTTNANPLSGNEVWDKTIRTVTPSESGSYPVRVEVLGANTHELLASQEVTVHVEESYSGPDPVDPDPPDYSDGSDSDSGSGGSDGGELAQAGLPMSTVAGLGFVALIMILLISLLR